MCATAEQQAAGDYECYVAAPISAALPRASQTQWAGYLLRTVCNDTGQHCWCAQLETDAAHSRLHLEPPRRCITVAPRAATTSCPRGWDFGEQCTSTPYWCTTPETGQVSNTHICVCVVKLEVGPLAFAPGPQFCRDFTHTAPAVQRVLVADALLRVQCTRRAAARPLNGRVCCLAAGATSGLVFSSYKVQNCMERFGFQPSGPPHHLMPVQVAPLCASVPFFVFIICACRFRARSVPCRSLQYLPLLRQTETAPPLFAIPATLCPTQLNELGTPSNAKTRHPRLFCRFVRAGRAPCYTCQNSPVRRQSAIRLHKCSNRWTR